MGDQIGKLWMKAASFAAQRHHGQIRKDGRTPYIAHPFRVAMVVRDVFGFDDERILAAALLHDTIEDTATDYDDIHRLCGKDVADIVAALTKDMRAPDERREAAYDAGLAEASWEARLIKLADAYDNITDSLTLGKTKKIAQKVDRVLRLVERDEILRDAAEQLRAHLKQIQEAGGEQHD